MRTPRRTHLIWIGLLVVVVGICVDATWAVQPAAGPATSQPNTPTRPWSFAAIADNRSAAERPEGSYEGVLSEIRDLVSNPVPKFPPIEFVIAAGDIKTSANKHQNWNLWLDTFKTATTRPAYFPLVGNWDDGDAEFNRKVIMPAQKGIVGADPEKYYVDWKNVRVIVSRDRPFVEKTIQSAPKEIQHIFIADHYPVFPRYHYAGRAGADGVAFWKMLLTHKDRVKAVFAGHTHHYSRMRVADADRADRDTGSFPDEPGGIFQIDCGNAGRSSHGENLTSLVEVLIDGPKASLRTMQADNATPTKFRIADQCDLAPPAAPQPTTQPGGT